MTLLGLLLIACCQDPAPSAPVPTPLDVVELKNGDVLHGRVLVAIDGFVEIEIEAGARVGFPSAQVAAIRRGAAVAPSVQTIVAPRREWFVVHDAAGVAVGWLASAVVHRPDGGFAVQEEYEFHAGERRFQVTSLATADSGGAPVSAYFRERVTEPTLGAVPLAGGDFAGQQVRVVDERIVEAECRGDALVVTRLDRHGRRERTLPWSTANSFPLLARTLARARRGSVARAELFDPATEELVRRSYDGRRQRSIAQDGKIVQITELTETGGGPRNHEWVDANARTLRRELAGPALVAVPANAASAVAVCGAVAPALVSDAGNAFGLWLPNPAWTPVADLPAGNLALQCEAHGASVTLTQIDHLEPDASLESAVDAVANAFRLVHPGARIVERRHGRLRDCASAQLAVIWKQGKEPMRATLDVTALGDAHVVFNCAAPERAWEELAADFDFLRAGVEFAPQALQPRLQGPLAKKGAGKAAPAKDAAPAAAERPLPLPATPAGESAPRAKTVRIPTGG
ncbi:MAG: DUF1795 domain-containing protein [Planctomycetes bacterium]|nr:DUF1795 domain-containing protein [Planctomycetota bacterium]